jgi:hypothetical protein
MPPRKQPAIALEVSEVINRTFTAGNQSVNVAITGNRIEVTGGTPEAVAIVEAILGVSQPAPVAGPTPAPARTPRKPAATTGKGSGQAGKKRGPYKRKGQAAPAEATEGATVEAVTQDEAAAIAEPTIATDGNGNALPATLTPFDPEANDEATEQN